MAEPLTPDTQAILLLCGWFGEPLSELLKPLDPAEYDKLAQGLQRKGLRPKDLILGSAADVLRALDLQGLDRTRVEHLLQRGAALGLTVEEWHRGGFWVLSRADSAYPKILKAKLGRAASPLLHGIGDRAILETGGLGILASRDADAKALAFAREAAFRCAADGISVVLDGSRGVDTEALVAAAVAGGRATGIFADGLARAAVTSRFREGLKADRLVLVSPFHPNAGFKAGREAARNALIHALSQWSLIVSATSGSGDTWNGAIEDLRHRWTPLFVRAADGGNRDLIARGGVPFEAEALREPTSLVEVLETLAKKWDLAGGKQFAQLDVLSAENPIG